MRRAGEERFVVEWQADDEVPSATVMKDRRGVSSSAFVPEPLSRFGGT
jgi:hypothetical protein